MAAVTNMESTLSRTQKVPTPKTSRHVRNTAAARIPVELPPVNLRTSMKIISAEMPTAIAEGKRKPKAFSPNRVMDTALSQ